MKSLAILALALLLPSYIIGSERSLQGVSAPLTAPYMRMQAIHFEAKASRGRKPNAEPEKIGGLKFYSDDEPLFSERIMGVWCEKTGSGELLKDEYQRCMPLLQDWEWEEAFMTNKIELIYENYDPVDGEDSNIMIKDEEFWFFNKNILKSATTQVQSVIDNEDGKLLALRSGHFNWVNVWLYIPQTEPADEIPIVFKIKTTGDSATALKLKGVPVDDSDIVEIEYECSGEESGYETVSYDDWYECEADAGGYDFKALVFAALDEDVVIKNSHFFYNRINIWYSVTDYETKEKTIALGAGKVAAGQYVKMLIDPKDCKQVCCFIQEEYGPYPQCKMYCDDGICLKANKGKPFPTEYSCCEEVHCKDRPEQCWTAASYWPERTCTVDSTKCYEGKVFETEEECCAKEYGAFHHGCTHIEGEAGPCWKQRSDAPYPHCEKIKNKECEPTDGKELENIVLGKPIRMRRGFSSSYKYRRYSSRMGDGDRGTCASSWARRPKEIRIDLKEHRNIKEIMVYTWRIDNDYVVQLGDSYKSDNPECTQKDHYKDDPEELRRFECPGPGKYLHILKGPSKKLKLCEVEIWARHIYNDMLVSKGKPAVQSSTWWTHAASKAVDGVIKFNKYHGCAQTHYEMQPYWGVDLETPRWITRIKVMHKNRKHELRNIEVRIGTNEHYYENEEIMLVPHVSHRYIEFQLPKLVVGRYVSIHSLEYSTLRFCEVQVFAGPIDWGPSNYFPTEETCCNSHAFDINPCREQPKTPCYKVGSWWPQKKCVPTEDEPICLRGWGVWDTYDECCQMSFYYGCDA